MKIDFNKYDLTGFKKVPCIFSGVECFLIYPEDITIRFNDSNKIFRSSIWTKDGEPVSLGFRKFENFGEQPSFEPLNISEHLYFSEKIDGSCLIVSMFKGTLIIRTRQTTDARNMTNGEEIDLLIKKYPKAFNNEYLYKGYTCIYEWTTPSNIIVLRYGNEPQLWLTGIIDHEDYSYIPQDKLDLLSILFEVNRGKNYNFNSFYDMQDCIKALNDKEGVVVYSADGQILKKVKSLKYLYIHKLKSKLNSIETLVDFFLAHNCIDADSFKKSLCENIDFEIIQMVEDDAKKIGAAYFWAVNEIAKFQILINSLNNLSRKDQALAIMKHDKQNSWLGFQLLDKKPINEHTYKKLIMQKV